METVVVELRREGGFDFWRFDLGKWAFSEICYMGVFGGGDNRIDTLWAMAGIPQVNDNDLKRLNGRSCMRGNLWKG